VNGYRLVEAAVYAADRHVTTHGDIFVAVHPFSLTSSPTYRHQHLSLSLSLSSSFIILCVIVRNRPACFMFYTTYKQIY